MSDVQIWYEDNDMVIEISSVQDDIAGTPVDNATIVATLQDSSGIDVPGIIWPITVPNIGSGLYRIVVDKAAQVLSGQRYLLLVTLTAPGGVDAYWEVGVGGEVRTG